MVIHWRTVIHILHPVRQIPFAAVRHSVTICNKSTWMEFKLKRCHWHRDKLEKRTMRACVEILQRTFIRTSAKVCSELCASIKVNQNLSIVCDWYMCACACARAIYTHTFSTFVEIFHKYKTLCNSFLRGLAWICHFDDCFWLRACRERRIHAPMRRRRSDK